ncbi:TPA: hypothetical protein DCL37_08805 [Candidatus Acetothermia bacterium]|nr:hypothetical protein [Candidatus Acetothermia bacterium]
MRKWVRRYQGSGEAGLLDRPPPPHSTPSRTPLEVEEKVLSLSQERGWGRRRYETRAFGAVHGGGALRRVPPGCCARGGCVA